MDLFSILLGVVFVLFASIGAGLTPAALTPNEFLWARVCFCVAAAALVAAYLVWFKNNQDTAQWLRILVGLLAGGIAIAGLPQMLSWVDAREKLIQEKDNPPEQRKLSDRARFVSELKRFYATGGDIRRYVTSAEGEPDFEKRMMALWEWIHELGMWTCTNMGAPALNKAIPISYGAVMKDVPANQSPLARKKYMAIGLINSIQQSLSDLIERDTWDPDGKPIPPVGGCEATVGKATDLPAVFDFPPKQAPAQPQPAPAHRPGKGGSGTIIGDNARIFGGRGGNGPGGGDGGSGFARGDNALVVGGDAGNADGTPPRSPLQHLKDLSLSSSGLERAELIAKLRQEYILSHDGLSAAMLAGTEPVPNDWVNKRLKEMGYALHYEGNAQGFTLTDIASQPDKKPLCVVTSKDQSGGVTACNVGDVNQGAPKHE